MNEEGKNFHKLQGVLHKIDNTITKKTAKGDFYTREFILEVRNEYEGKTFTELPKFHLKQDKVGMIDYHEVGDTVMVHFRVTGRKWVSKEKEEVYFTELAAYKIEPISSGAKDDGKVDVTSMPGVNDIDAFNEKMDGDDIDKSFDMALEKDDDLDLPF